jgi:hypothetical protein
VPRVISGSGFRNGHSTVTFSGRIAVLSEVRRNLYTIDTKPQQSGKFVAECTFQHELMLGALTRHTHRWGTDFSVWFEGGSRHGEHVWTSSDWQHDVDFPFDPPLSMKKGEGFRFECSYKNTQDRPLRFGTNATDEMCILFGLAWNAGAERTLPSQNCAITWTDAEGTAHSARDLGFPRASEADAARCVAGRTPQGTEPTECAKCQCGACGSILIRCATDPDCKPSLDCRRDPANNCQPVIDEHSSAVGLLRQVTVCLESSGCSAACAG